MRGFGWEGTLWCWAVSGEAYWLWARSLYRVVHCIYPGNNIKTGYNSADSYKMRQHCLSHNIWLWKHPRYHPLTIDFSQNSGYPYSTSIDVVCKKNSRQKRNITVFYANTPTDHWVIIIITIIFSFHHYCLACCQTFTCCAKTLFAIQQKVWTHEKKV